MTLVEGMWASGQELPAIRFRLTGPGRAHLEQGRVAFVRGKPQARHTEADQTADRGSPRLTRKSSTTCCGMQQESDEHGVGEKKCAEDVGQPVRLKAEHVPGRSEV